MNKETPAQADLLSGLFEAARKDEAAKHQGELQQAQSHYEEKMRERVAMERHQLEKEKMERVGQLE